MTVSVCAGGAGLLFAATQKSKLMGLTLTVLFWATAVSRQPKTVSSTKTAKVIDLKGVFTKFSTCRGEARSCVCNPDASILLGFGCELALAGQNRSITRDGRGHPGECNRRQHMNGTARAACRIVDRGHPAFDMEQSIGFRPNWRIEREGAGPSRHLPTFPAQQALRRSVPKDYGAGGVERNRRERVRRQIISEML